MVFDNNYNDNLQLFKLYEKTKSIKLRNKIALNNYNLIYKGLQGLYSPNIHDKEELEQEAFICLLKAVERYDLLKGFKFSTFAIYYIKAVTRKRLDYNKDLSLDKPLSNDDEDFTIGDTIEDEKINIFKSAESQNIRNNLKKLLNKNQYKVIFLHYLQDKSYKEISDIMGLSHEQVKLIEFKAEIKITGSRYFKEYKNGKSNDDEITYLKAYDYSRPYIQTNKISNPVFNTLLELEEREKGITRDFIKDKLN